MRVGVARHRHRVSLETVSVSLPFGIGSMAWKVDTTQKKAAWSLYVELVTRIAPLGLRSSTQPCILYQFAICNSQLKNLDTARFSGFTFASNFCEMVLALTEPY
ncbi:hypothetical protein H6G95_26020 [Nostoc linckia FACHB-391]|uniref:Uncharacterized protein n=3 Tax=Nostoc TaxID=1177 RepID=A0ABR8IBU7_9NOSO|nr:hypothetical protein [Nostoc linckia]MBD2564000.1 hypothetical protein [Nostoc linckia FACHB-391]MBD2648025.1 hypothetical protein [Nostoc foliaceum FACHB-393]